MIDYKEKKSTDKERKIESITCDKCGIPYDYSDTFEIQEFHHINFRGGYGSDFGDGTQVNCDLCQYCLKLLLGIYCRCVDEEDDDRDY